MSQSSGQTRTESDDMSFPVAVPRRVRRVVSCPVAHRAVAETARSCSSAPPAGAPIRRSRRRTLRGTKTGRAADRRAGSGPGAAEQEENRELDHQRLSRRGSRLGHRRGGRRDRAAVAGEAVLGRAGTAGAAVAISAAEELGGPAPSPSRAPPSVWRDPWMVVGSSNLHGPAAAHRRRERVRRPRRSLSPVAAGRDQATERPRRAARRAVPVHREDGPESSPAPRARQRTQPDWYGPSLVDAKTP